MGELLVKRLPHCLSAGPFFFVGYYESPIDRERSGGGYVIAHLELWKLEGGARERVPLQSLLFRDGPPWAVESGTIGTGA